MQLQTQLQPGAHAASIHTRQTCHVQSLPRNYPGMISGGACTAHICKLVYRSALRGDTLHFRHKVSRSDFALEAPCGMWTWPPLVARHIGSWRLQLGVCCILGMQHAACRRVKTWMGIARSSCAKWAEASETALQRAFGLDVFVAATSDVRETLTRARRRTWGGIHTVLNLIALIP